MKKITLSVEESVLKDIRKIAAERETTINGLVRDFLGDLAETRKREKARQDLLKLIPGLKSRVGEIRWNREELHAR